MSTALETENLPTDTAIKTDLPHFQQSYQAMIERYRCSEVVLDKVPHAIIVKWFPEKGSGFAKLEVLPPTPLDQKGPKVKDQVFVHATAIDGCKRGEDLTGIAIVLDSSDDKNPPTKLNRERNRFEISNAITAAKWQKENSEVILAAEFRNWLEGAIEERLKFGKLTLTFSGDKQTLDKFGTPFAVIGNGVRVNETTIPLLSTYSFSDVKPRYYLDVDDSAVFNNLPLSELKLASTQDGHEASILGMIELHQSAESAIKKNLLETEAIYEDPQGRRMVLLKTSKMLDSKGSFGGDTFAALVDIDTGDTVRMVSGNWKSVSYGDAGYFSENTSSGIEYEFSVPSDLNLKVSNLGDWGSEVNDKNIFLSTVSQLLHEIKTEGRGQYGIESALKNESYALEQIKSKGKTPAQTYGDIVSTLSRKIDLEIFSELVKGEVGERKDNLGVLLEIAKWQIEHNLVSEQDVRPGILYGLSVKQREDGGYFLELGDDTALAVIDGDKVLRPFREKFKVSVDGPRPNFAKGYFEVSINQDSYNKMPGDPNLPSVFYIPLGEFKAPAIKVPEQYNIVGYKKYRKNSIYTFVLFDKANSEPISYYSDSNACWLPGLPKGYEKEDETKITQPRLLEMLAFQSKLIPDQQ